MKEKIDPLKRKRSAGFSILAALLLIGSGGRAQQLANQAAPENMSTADDSLRSGLLLQNYSDLYPVLNGVRSEEHTSELQSLMRISYAVFCLKKKTQHDTKCT